MKYINSILAWIRREAVDYKILFRSIPSLVVSVFVLCVVAMNILANRELFTTKYLALDCGFAISWITFLIMDVICKRFGPKAAIKLSIVALAINLFICLIFYLITLTPGNWGEFYTYSGTASAKHVNDALNKTFGGSWYVVLISAFAMLVSSSVNAIINYSIGLVQKYSNFRSFIIRSYTSTIIAQFIDNMIFATFVSRHFFGWSWTQVFLCSVTAASIELVSEALFSPFGYKLSQMWARESVGKEYLDYHRQSN